MTKEEGKRMKLAVQIDDESGSLRESGINEPDAARLEAVWLEYLEAKYPSLASAEQVSVSIKYCPPSEIRDLNSRYRDMDETTDVLSFPMWEADGVFTAPEGWVDTPLGDIAICPEVVKSNALSENRDPETDFALILMHGFLHLLAWDHDTETREIEMSSEQETLLKRYLEKV
jgi:probable rRNA maturation factor